MLRLRSRPLPAPEEGDLSAQERASWAALSIELDGLCLTEHSPTAGELPATPAPGREVEGPLSGLAEWIVECWPALLWETHTPFPKPSANPDGVDAIPSTRDAVLYWDRFVALDLGRVGAWQHRHTLGHGASDLSVPPLLFLPDDEHVGIVVGEIPREQDPTTRLVVPEQFRGVPVWVPRDDLAFTLRSFVDSIIENARANDDARHWGSWLKSEFERARSEADTPAGRRRWILGETAAGNWDVIERSYGTLSGAIEGVAIDSRQFTARQELSGLAECLRPKSTRRTSGRWSTLDATTPLRVGVPFEQGYALASRVRDAIGLRQGPIDLDKMLRSLDVELGVAKSFDQFRSAVVRDDHGRARIVYSEPYFSEAGIAPRNFAIAAALGKLLAPGSPSKQGGFGAAQGVQSRWRSTQFANAFAAELHAPIEAVRAIGDPVELVERYGLSRSAAEWHFRNRRRDASTVRRA